MLNFKYQNNNSENNQPSFWSFGIFNCDLLTLKKSQSGFTLIEMMVAISLFTVVMTVALGSLLTLIDANKKAQAIQTLMTNLNYVVDDISRNARVANSYHCASPTSLSNLGVPLDCSAGKGLFAFKTNAGDQIVFRINNARVEKSTNGATTFIPVTAKEIEIEKLTFYVSGAPDGDNEQPMVVMLMSGVISRGTKIETNFNIQTSITQRILDFN